MERTPGSERLLFLNKDVGHVFNVPADKRPVANMPHVLK
jgi:hypothetical protein